MIRRLPGSTADGTRQAYLMGAGLIGMGGLHFVAPKGFDAIIPDEIPADKRALTYASGVAELLIGAGLLMPQTRRLSALAAIALFVAVYPANLNTVRVVRDRSPAYRIAAVVRLPLQVPLITTAWRIYRRAGRKGRSGATD